MTIPIRKSGPVAVAARLAKCGAPVDSEHVQRIRTAINDGTYRVDAQGIAAAIIRGGG